MMRVRSSCIRRSVFQHKPFVVDNLMMQVGRCRAGTATIVQPGYCWKTIANYHCNHCYFKAKSPTDITDRQPVCSSYKIVKFFWGFVLLWRCTIQLFQPLRLLYSALRSKGLQVNLFSPFLSYKINDQRSKTFVKQHQDFGQAKKKF